MATDWLNSDQHEQRLRQRIREIEGHLCRFDQALATSKLRYEQAQALLIEPELKSALLESHTIYLNRQLKAVERMKALHQKVLHQRAAYEQNWLFGTTR